jgi:dTDP-4-amino-4,6-dideoxygalactose transaminase
MIPRLKPALGLAELAAALSLPRADDLERFEKAFARLMGQRHAIAVPYGRTGLALLLEALGLRNREVICPAYTCVVVPHAVVTSGNRPVFVDCEPGGFNMDLDLAEEAIGPHTGAVIATSIFGYPVDLDRLAELRQRHPQVAIIQDCAHSFAACWRERPVPREGVAAIFGLNVSKLITSIFGGMVTTDHDGLAAKLRQLSRRRLTPASRSKALRRLAYLLSTYLTFTDPIYGLVNRLERSGLLDRFVKYYDPALIDMPEDYLEGMAGVEARVGLAQIGKYHRIIAHRRKVASFYHETLQGLEGLHLPPLVPGATYSHYVPLAEDRPRLLEAMLSRGIQLGMIIEYSIPHLPAYRHSRALLRGHSLRYARTAVNLPVHWGIDQSRRERIVAELHALLKRKR